MDEQRMWNWMREKRNQGGNDDKNREARGAAGRTPSRPSLEPTWSDDEGPGRRAPAEDRTGAAPDEVWTRKAPDEERPRRTEVRAADPWAVTRPVAPDDGAISDEAKKTLRAALEKFREQQQAAPPSTPTEVRRPPSRRRPTPTEAPAEDIVAEGAGPVRGPQGKREIQDALDYLDEVLDDYERLVHNIGHNEFTAPMTLYYRDEVQELLDELTWAKIDIQSHWARTVELDNILREHAQALVDEIGWANFKQYQIINDPPRQYWWWYLNRETRAPAPPPAFWQFWKK